MILVCIRKSNNFYHVCTRVWFAVIPVLGEWAVDLEESRTAIWWPLHGECVGYTTGQLFIYLSVIVHFSVFLFFFLNLISVSWDLFEVIIVVQCILLYSLFDVKSTLLLQLLFVTVILHSNDHIKSSALCHLSITHMSVLCLCVVLPLLGSDQCIQFTGKKFINLSSLFPTPTLI